MGTELKNKQQKLSSIPVVALAGRPNTGKSTLFNRLLRKRKAITDPTPGVTRDPVEADCLIDDKLIRLVDTGGYKLTDCDEMDKLVIAKTMETIKRANLVVLLLDANDITSEDEEIIERLRPYREKLIVAVNKTEGGRKQADAWNIMSYGFDKIFMISAEHGDNIGELQQEIVHRLHKLARINKEGAESREQRTENNEQRTNENNKSNQTVIRLALLGKPNTGKSTLSNRLTKTDASIVSSVPGTTRDTIEGGFQWKPKTGKAREFTILDTAGIRRKAKVTDNIEYYSVNRAIKTINDADIVILMIDAEEGLTDQDKKITALAHDKGRGIIFALNKWDTMPQEKNAIKKITNKIRFQFGQMEYAPIIPISAKTGFGINELLSAAVAIHKQLNTSVTTGRLNQALEKWMAEHPPPSGPQTRFKIKYAVQKSANPVHFILFTSRVRAVSDSYISYLRNKMRKELGFSLIPILIDVKSSS